MRWCTDHKDYLSDDLFYVKDNASLCKECRKARANKRYLEKHDEIRKQQNIYNKEYVKRNRGKYRAKIILREAKLLRATPKWASKSKIEEIYKLAQELTERTGVPHQVDHIVPLRSKLVSGLHCENNLRVIPAEENLRKGNRTWPDMAI